MEVSGSTDKFTLCRCHHRSSVHDTKHLLDTDFLKLIDPTNRPSSQPSGMPSSQPSCQPRVQPSSQLSANQSSLDGADISFYHRSTEVFQDTFRSVANYYTSMNNGNGNGNGNGNNNKGKWKH